jgi:hypothetical protein
VRQLDKAVDGRLRHDAVEQRRRLVVPETDQRQCLDAAGLERHPLAFARGEDQCNRIRA